MITGACCGGCAEKIEKSVSGLRGINFVKVDPTFTKVDFEFDSCCVSKPQITSAIEALGYKVEKPGQVAQAAKTDEARDVLGNKSILSVRGLDCADCAAKLEKRILSLSGVSKVSLNFATAKMTLEHTLPLSTIIKAVNDAGYTAQTTGSVSHQAPKTVFTVGGLDCADCAAKLEKRIKAIDGVEFVDMNFATAKLVVKHSNSLDIILKSIRDAGYSAELQGSVKTDGQKNFWVENKRAVLTVVSGAFFLTSFILSFLGVSERSLIPLNAASMVIGGYYIARAGYYSLKSLTFDMNFLMSVAAIGAAFIGQLSEAAAVVVLFSLGNTLQAYTMDKTRRSIRGLMDLSPKEALVRRDSREISLPVGEIGVGDVIIVKPGERIAMDGTVINGTSSVNQAPITGESIPVTKQKGDEVFAGTINERGALEIEVTKLVEDTTLAKIIHLVEDAQAQKATSQHFVDVFAKYYTPAVISIAVGITLVPTLLLGQPFSPWFYKALVLLVIACPCALVISTPVSIVSAIGSAAKHGVLIKGGVYLEEAGKIKAVAFDKTGTLTNGRPGIKKVIEISGKEQEIVSIAGAIEKRSQHPLADAIVNYAAMKGVSIPETEQFEALTGKGAQAVVNGKKYFIGNTRLFNELGISLRQVEGNLADLQQQGHTVVILGTEDGILGLIAVADSIRENSAQAVSGLKEAGIEQVVLLTGDNQGTAAAIAAALKITDFRAELLPQDKLEAVRTLLAKYGKVAMVGDGVNDAPALASATIGIAMGGAGTDIALETADLALMADDLSKLPFAIRLSRKALGIIKQNIWFALVVKIAFIGLTFLGISNLWLAVIADTGAALAVIANGMRLLWVRP